MITYNLQGNVHRTGMHRATEVTLPFSVVSIKNLNHLPHLQQPQSIEDHKKFGMLFWKSKPLSAQISINKQAFVSGENILVSGLIKNESKTKITHCDLKLIKLVKYYAQRLNSRPAGYDQFHAREKMRSEKQTVYKCSQPGIDKESEVTWQNVPVFVPSLPPSHMDGCNFIDIQYFLEIRIVPPGIRFPLELTFEVTIGTIPFTQHPSPFVPAADCAAPPSYDIAGPSSEPSAPLSVTGPVVGSLNIPSAPFTPPVLTAAVPPPYGHAQPTYGVYCGDSNEPPAYDTLFRGGEENANHDDVTRNYLPKYPSFNIPPQ